MEQSKSISKRNLSNSIKKKKIVSWISSPQNETKQKNEFVSINKSTCLIITFSVIMLFFLFKFLYQQKQYPTFREEIFKKSTTQFKAFYVSSPTDLMKESYRGNFEKVKAILEKNKKVINAFTLNNETALHFALNGQHSTVNYQADKVIGEHFLILDYLLKSGADPSIGNFCPLYYSVLLRNCPATKLLLEQSSKSTNSICLKQRDYLNNTVLHHASKSKASGFARHFMKRKFGTKNDPLLEIFKISIPSFKKHGELTFHSLSNSVSEWDLDILLKYGASMEAKNILNRTPLLISVSESRISTINYWLEKNASTEVIDTFGMNIFHLISMNNLTQVFDKVFNQNSHINHLDKFNRTPIMLAAFQGYSEMVNLLLSQNADLHFRDERNYSVLDYAARSGNHKVFDILRSKLNQIQEKIIQVELINEISLTKSNYSEGGWNTTIPKSLTLPSSCTIDRRNSSITKEEFLRDYMTIGKPVIISGLTSNWTAWETWTKPNLLKHYGNRIFSVGEIPYASIYGVKTKDISLKDYIHYMESQQDPYPFYIFEGNIKSKIPNFLTHFTTPYLFEAFQPSLIQWILGPAMSGSQPHFHGQAWNALIYGKKRWFFFPPQHSFFSKKPAIQWYQEDYSKLNELEKPMECVQSSGDLVFIPYQWGHAVINLQESVALAVEFEIG